MNVYILTNKYKYTRIITIIANNISSEIKVREVNSNMPVIKESIKSKDIFIIDDKFYFNEGLKNFCILKELKQSVIILLENNRNIERYIELNVEQYFDVLFEWNDLKLIISRMFEEYKNNINNIGKYKDYSVKTKSGYKYFEYDDILFFENTINSVIISTKNNEYTVKDSLDSIIVEIPNSFARVHDSFIINYYNIIGIKDYNSKVYSLYFEGSEKIAYMSKSKYIKCISNLSVDYIIEFKKEGLIFV